MIWAPRYSEFEHISKPSQPIEGWLGYEEYEYRVSWRIYRAENGKEYRDFIVCHDEWDQISLVLESLFGPRGQHWDFNPPFMYLFLRTNADAVLFRLNYTLPSD